jgi:Na+-translocating ferredoxin:NAD+ oxidoreductase RnfG subunit
MIKFLYIALLVASSSLYAKAPSLEKIFKETFGNNVSIGQKNILLTREEKQDIEKQAKAKIDSPKIRFYVITESKKIKGYGVLLIQRIRTKKAVLLYLIDKNQKIKNIEILAFHEPSEYKPYSTWKEAFVGKGKEDKLKEGYAIPTISGATLSARAITKASRIALSIVEKETK